MEQENQAAIVPNASADFSDRSAERHRLLFAIVGLTLGGVYWLLVHRVTKPGATYENWMPVVTATVTVWALAIQFAWDARRARRMSAVLIALALICAPVTYWVGSQASADSARGGDSYRAMTWLAAYWIALYVLIPFVQIFQRTGRLRFPYPALFFHSWNNFFIACIALSFTAVFWGLLAIWGGLFHILGVDLFWSIFRSRSFLILATTTMLGIGIAIGRETERTTDALRRVTLTQFRALLPILVAIVFLFLLDLPLTGVQPLWSTKAASPLLLGLIVTVVLFVNAVLQDGEAEPPRPWLRIALEATALATPILCALLFWAIGLRIRQYGITPDRIYVVVFASIATLYSLSYAVAIALRRAGWVAWLRRINVAMAVLVASLAFLLHTPLLDPIAWSARNQAWRLLSGRVSPEQFDYAALRDLGRVGAAAFDRLTALENHPQAEKIRRLALSTRDGEPVVDRRLASGDFIEGSANPVPTLLDALQGMGALATDCKRERTCGLIAVDLVDDGAPEYCIIAARHDQVYCWYRWQSTWAPLTVSRTDFNGPLPDLWDAFERSGATVLMPSIRDLQIGETRFDVRR